MLEFEAKVRKAQDELNAKFKNPADFDKNANGWSGWTLSIVHSSSIDPTNQKQIKCTYEINKIALKYFLDILSTKMTNFLILGIPESGTNRARTLSYRYISVRNYQIMC